MTGGAFPAAELLLFPYLMPDFGHTRAEVWDVANFLLAQDAIGAKRPLDAVTPDRPEQHAPHQERHGGAGPTPAEDDGADTPAPRAGRLDVHA